MSIFKTYDKIDHERLKTILEKMKEARVAVIGDAVLDIYWEADMKLSELSRETPHYILPIVEERFSPGAGANVAANLKTLGLNEVTLLTSVGNDWRGELLIELLLKENINIDYLIKDDNYITPAYCKPIKQGLSDIKMECPRLDFKNFNKISRYIEKHIIKYLELIIKNYDSVAICDQQKYGLINNNVIKQININSSSGLVIVDSRRQIGKFKNAILKPNHIEAKNAINPDENIEGKNLDYYKQIGVKLSKRQNSPIVLTLGQNGALWINKEELIEIPTQPASAPLDIVGAGDAFLSAFMSAMACNAKPEEAIFIGNLAAGVTVKKINTTGSANINEILNMYKSFYGEIINE